MDRKEMRALSFRGDILTRGNDTNNFAEAAMRVLKDKILQRTKAFSVPQLADFMCTMLQDHYHQRLVNVGNGRLDYAVTSKYMPATKTITKNDIKQVNYVHVVHE